MGSYRVFFVWGAGTLFVLGLFLLFMAVGWPGAPDTCIHVVKGAATSNTCYCEAFDFHKVVTHASGVRQPVNTWFNLYAIGTSLWAAILLYLDRQSANVQNVMRSNNPIADAYIFALMFLGIGSMWFHAALTRDVDWIDGLSMYVYAAFLVFYTIRRLWPSDLFFWIAYPATVVVFTILNVVISGEFTSLILILILVVVYLFFELLIAPVVTHRPFLLGTPRAVVLWCSAVAAILLATFFWIFSQTGKFLCTPHSAFQPHGELWHTLAGVMALLLFFYWREET